MRPPDTLWTAATEANHLLLAVIPAKAGIQLSSPLMRFQSGTPAFAGVTGKTEVRRNISVKLFRGE